MGRNESKTKRARTSGTKKAMSAKRGKRGSLKELPQESEWAFDHYRKTRGKETGRAKSVSKKSNSFERYEDLDRKAGKRAAKSSSALKENRKGYEKRTTHIPVNKKAEPQIDNNEVIEREDRIEGRNSTIEALRSDRPVNKVFVEKDNEDSVLLRIAAMAREKGIPVQYLERYKLDSMSQTRAHQGVILEVAAQEYVEVDDILSKAKSLGEKPFILALDGITDTNNLGSIIRSAECAGVHGIILPKRRSATLNATVAKVAAGALEYVPVSRVTNLVQTLRSLKGEGLWIIGADMDGESNYYDADLTGPCVLVIGSEGEGLGRLVKDECDLMVRIPMRGKISSLNAGVAAALVMFEISKQRASY